MVCPPGLVFVLAAPVDLVLCLTGFGTSAAYTMTVRSRYMRPCTVNMGTLFRTLANMGTCTVGIVNIVWLKTVLQSRTSQWPDS